MNLDTAHLIDMTSQPLWQYYISVILVMAPAVRILTRAGFKPYPVLLLLAPWVGYIFCAAYLTFTKWPKLPPKEAKS